MPNTYVRDTICRVQLELAYRIDCLSISSEEKQGLLALVDRAFNFGKRMDTKLGEYRRRYPGQLMTDGYLQQQRLLHSAPRGFGGSGHRWAGVVAGLIEQYHVDSWLDYGCGQGTLHTAVQQQYPEVYGLLSTVREFDPAVSGKDKLPAERYGLVTCTDVLEHVEEKFLDQVLKHIFALTEKLVFFNIALHPANKILPDGRNAHLIQRPAEWWVARIQRKRWRVERSDSPRPNKDLNLVVTNNG